MEELKELLKPGAEVVFNSLFLDPYLWDLHFRKAGLVVKLKREGAPIKGVTVSAGIPEVDEASALLEELEGADLAQCIQARKRGSGEAGLCHCRGE